MKKWYASKTLWVNALAFVGIFVQVQTGTDVVSGEVQAAFLTIINMILHVITKEGLK